MALSGCQTPGSGTLTGLMQLPLTSKIVVRDDPLLAATCGRPGLQGQAGSGRGRSYSIWTNAANPVAFGESLGAYFIVDGPLFLTGLL